MADITTSITDWDYEIYEYYQQGEGDSSPVSIDVQFIPDLFAHELFDSFTITSEINVQPYGIVIGSDRITGSIADYFEANGAVLELTIRDRESLTITTVNGFSNLPEAGKADVIYFNPPSEQSRVITFDVTMTYMDITDPMLPVKLSLTKQFPVTLRGSYSGWAGKLRDYIRACGPFHSSK